MIINYESKTPEIHDSVFVADDARIIGNVRIGKSSSIWFGAVIRGDMESITIGEKTNIQDLSLLHVPVDAKLEIGDNVTIGHRAIVHGCKIGNNCLIGMGSIIMDSAEIGDNCIIGAGSLVTQGTIIPSGSMAFGSPAKVKKEVTPEEVKMISKNAAEYSEYARRYMK